MKSLKACLKFSSYLPFVKGVYKLMEMNAFMNIHEWIGENLDIKTF